MAYACKILADSVNIIGDRLTTFEVTFPRIILAEANTHRMLSRNSASSRAIPVSRMLERVGNDPFTPSYWGKNQKGMSAEEELDAAAQERAQEIWLRARDMAVGAANSLMELGVHKQITNRLLEPFLWHTAIISATSYSNFFKLRCHKDAQPEIKKIADMMQDMYRSHHPVEVQPGDWHLPFVPDRERLLEEGIYKEDFPKVSTGRTARVSYLTHDGVREPKLDVALCSKLSESGHWSPFEHPARALSSSTRIRNYVGWEQYRAMVDGD